MKKLFPLLAMLAFLSTPAFAQYVRTDCDSLTLVATEKATCFDYTTFTTEYWNGSAWIKAAGNPAGATTQVQFNNAAVLAGDATFTFNATSKTVTIQSLSLATEIISPVTEVTMSATLVLVANSSTTYQFLNPNGAVRQVDLPVAATGMTFFIMNIGTGVNTITVKDNGGATVDTIDDGEFNTYIYSGTAWRVI